jgi:TfoX/Sxy family transcriptional regulator of competence genes
MAFDEQLAARVRKILAGQNLFVEEKKMMGGLTFMVNEKMCVGILKDELMARIAPEEYEGALSKDGCRPMDFTGKPMTGFVFVNSSQTSSDNDLEYWVQLALAFNSRAKASLKVKRKRA